jgi:hypothetical protein
MARELIPKTSYNNFKDIWNNNRYNIVFIKDSIEYYVCGFVVNPYSNEISDILPYNPQKNGSIKDVYGHANFISFDIEKDELYIET